MKDNKNSSQKEPTKSDITIDKHKIKEKSKKSMKNNALAKNSSCNNEKNENFVVNKEMLLRKTYVKNNSSETELIRLQKKNKKNIYNSIQKNSETYGTDSEKNETSKICELSINKIMIRPTEKKIFECSKEGKNKEQKSLENYNSEEANSHKIEKKMIDKQKGIERDNNKLYENYYKNDFVENKYVLNNIKIQKRYISNNKNKYNKIYIIYFCLFIISKIFFSQNIKCDNDFASSYINLKIKGTGNIKILSDFYKGKSPDNITINNAISYTKNIDNEYNFENSENNIIYITLTWNESITSTSNMFTNCVNITEIDLSNFDASSVKNMNSMFSGCSSLTSLILSNFNTSKVENMNRIFSNCEKLEYVN